MHPLYEESTFVADASLFQTRVTEFTPPFEAGRGSAFPILDDRDECGNDKLWCDLIAPSAGHVLMWNISNAYTKEVDLHWTASATEYIVDVYSVNGDPSQPIDHDSPRYPAEVFEHREQHVYTLLKKHNPNLLKKYN